MADKISTRQAYGDALVAQWQQVISPRGKPSF